MMGKKNACKFLPGLIFKEATLTTKLTFYVTSSILLVGFLLGIFLGQKNFFESIDDAYNLAEKRIETIKEPTSLALYHLDRDTVEALIKSLDGDPNYRYIRILSDNDRVYASIPNPSESSYLTQKIIRHFLNSHKRRKIYSLFFNVPHPDKKEIYVGRIDYEINLDYFVNQALSSFFDTFIITIYQSLILSFIIASIMYWLVGKPLSEFSGYINKRAKGKKTPGELQIKTHGSEMKALVDNYKLYTNENEKYLHDLTIKNQYLEQLSRRDTLTGGYNRRELMSQLENQLNQEALPHCPVFVVNWDIDQFSRINGQFGQDIGDKVLKGVYCYLKNTFKDYSEIFRLQSDVFAMYCPGHADKQFIDLLKNRLSFSLNIEDGNLSSFININLTAGISQAPQDAVAPEPLLYAANIGLVNAKQAGHNCIRNYSREAEDKKKSSLTALNILREQINEPSFFLAYQPKVSLSEGTVAGCEALFRTSEKDNFAPFDLLNCAEETGLIVPLGTSILERAIKDFSHLLPDLKSSFRLSVNVSPQQLIQSDFSSLLKNLLHSYAFPGHNLDLEVTEATQLISNSNFKKNHQELVDIGVSFSLDDFGTGYASIEYLLFIGFDFLKIDRQFVKNIPNDYNSLRICRIILKLAKEVGSQTVVEGIENEVHEKIMQQEGATFGQGYHYAKPLRLEEFIKYYEEKS
ncbi:EAL domain-containing protein [Vreelandella aquamarina]